MFGEEERVMQPFSDINRQVRFFGRIYKKKRSKEKKDGQTNK